MKRGTKLLLAVLTAFLVLGITATAGLTYAREHVVMLWGRPYLREARQLDLKGQPLKEPLALEQFPNLETLDARGCGLTRAQYRELARLYPRLEILWDVPFQGGTVDSNATRLRLTTLTEDDIRDLTYLKNLKSVEAWDCEDYDALVLLQDTRPECKVFYSVTLGHQEFDCDIQKVVLSEAEGDSWVDHLRYLPNVTDVTLIWPLPEWDSIRQAMEAYPHITFEWEVLGFHKVYWGQTLRELSLSRDQIQSVSQLEEVLPYLPHLKTVDLRDCSLPGEELVDLCHRWPDIDFLFRLTIGHVTVSTDAAQIDISNHKFDNTDQVERYVRCFPNLQKIILCECGLPYEDLSALNEKYEDLRFVWSVELGGKLFRTDSVYFTPNRTGIKVDDAAIYNLRYCTDMVCIDIGHMEDVTSCEWAAFMPNLKYLILAQTKIQDLTPLSGLKNLVYLELFQSAVRDYSPLLSCTALEDINLCYTYGDPTPISQMPWLKRIWWSGWWSAQALLTQTHPHARLEFNTVSSTGNGWREGQHYYDMRDFIGMKYMTG